MKKLLILALALLPLPAVAQAKTDTYDSAAGPVKITLLGHGTLMIGFDGKTIHVDPYSRVANYDTLPKADLILITHEHGDHFDKAALATIRTSDTEVISNKVVADQYEVDLYMDNGDVYGWNNIQVEAVPAYNIVNLRDGVAYHPKGTGNGYVLTFGRNFTVYIAGDTEPIPEMSELEDIDVAFLPKNLPYTMSDEQFVKAAQVVKPKVLYPYHYSQIDWDWLRKQLPGIELK